jgi:hypothetical protein
MINAAHRFVGAEGQPVAPAIPAKGLADGDNLRPSLQVVRNRLVSRALLT